MLHNMFIQKAIQCRNIARCSSPSFKNHFVSSLIHKQQRRGFHHQTCLYNPSLPSQTNGSITTVDPSAIVQTSPAPITVVQTSVVDGVISTSGTSSTISATTTNGSSSQPSTTAATIVIIQQQQQPGSIAPSTGENGLSLSSPSVGEQVVPPTANQQQTIIQIDTQVFSKQIEQAVKQQMKQNLTKHAYEPTGEESFEIIEHLERERLYEEGKGKGLIYQFKRFMKKKTSLLTNLLAVGKVLPANAIMSLFFSFHKMEQNYKERIFAQRITASLNFVDKKTGTFKIRNIFCKNLDEVVLNNQAVVQVIQEAASKTNREAPIVILPDEDKWFILNLVQSCISQNVASGYFRQDMMLKHHSEWYVFAITNETDVSIRKMRVVIVQEKLLKAIHDGTVNHPEFEHVYGEIRWNTVKLMSKMYHEQYDSIMETGFGDLQRVEVVLSGSLAD